MKDSLYKDFSDPTNEFSKEPRAFCYDLASQLICEAQKNCKGDWVTDTNTIKGILLLLFTWNFMARQTKALNFDNVSSILKEVESDIMLLEHYSIMNFTVQVSGNIRSAFNKFKLLCGQTGASKALSLLNSHLFVMWDTAIRERLRKELIPGIGNGESGEKYVIFLRGVQNIIRRYDLIKKLPPDSNIAKKFDEYNYVKIVMPKNRAKRSHAT